MSGVCRAVDAMLDGYLFTQAVADGNDINWRDILNRTDLAELFVGVAGLAAHLRGELARERGVPVEVLDEELIGALMVEGALS